MVPPWEGERESDFLALGRIFCMMMVRWMLMDILASWESSRDEQLAAAYGGAFV
jgi:hypothetical protein